MCTVTLSYDGNNALAQENLEVLLGTGLFVKLYPHDEDASPHNRVYIEDGEVKTETVTDEMDLEEMRHLLHEMVDLEYSLP